MGGTLASATLPGDGAASGDEGLTKDRYGSAGSRGREPHFDIMGVSGVNPASWRVFSTPINGLTTIVATTASLTNVAAWSQFKLHVSNPFITEAFASRHREPEEISSLTTMNGPGREM
jgi:hypothetical protein